MTDTDDYDWVLVDAESYIANEQKVRELRAIELYSMLARFKHLHPEARYVVTFDAEDEEESAEGRMQMFAQAGAMGWIPLRSRCTSFDAYAWFVFTFLGDSSARCLLVSRDERSFGLLSDRVELLYRGPRGIENWTASRFVDEFRYQPEQHWLRLACVGEATLWESFEKVEPIKFRDDLAVWLRSIPPQLALEQRLRRKLESILPKRLTLQGESLFRYWLHRRGNPNG
ncbi:hypothetical protein [Pelagicoccus sp. SDUM812002]|uniref:hypothetical protein n=1 Tax=Pelagicoccus sp. SDUM812002 TaxID=3041266 RepID=UPI0028108162|nr:hypothetical protein [Pelagicoccus sp. SDUM812002]MDQ8188157.1 hypothetical protein [Pelagicoccus sp. SDUM812002]